MTTQIIMYDPEDTYPADTSIAMLGTVIERFDLEKKAFIHQTIHGHIATFERKEGRYIPLKEAEPRRMDSDDLRFFHSLPFFRWLENSERNIRLGFDNTQATCAGDSPSANENALVGIRCPRCESTEPFIIETIGPDPDKGDESGEPTHYLAKWYDDGSEDTLGSTEIADESLTICCKCFQQGHNKAFRY